MRHPLVLIRIHKSPTYPTYPPYFPCTKLRDIAYSLHMYCTRRLPKEGGSDVGGQMSEDLRQRLCCSGFVFPVLGFWCATWIWVAIASFQWASSARHTSRGLPDCKQAWQRRDCETHTVKSGRGGDLGDWKGGRWRKRTPVEMMTLWRRILTASISLLLPWRARRYVCISVAACVLPHLSHAFPP